jgi:hypothetical protein
MTDTPKVSEPIAIPVVNTSTSMGEIDCMTLARDIRNLITKSKSLITRVTTELDTAAPLASDDNEGREYLEMVNQMIRDFELIRADTPEALQNEFLKVLGYDPSKKRIPYPTLIECTTKLVKESEEKLVKYLDRQFSLGSDEKTSSEAGPESEPVSKDSPNKIEKPGRYISWPSEQDILSILKMIRKELELCEQGTGTVSVCAHICDLYQTMNIALQTLVVLDCIESHDRLVSRLDTSLTHLRRQYNALHVLSGSSELLYVG